MHGLLLERNKCCWWRGRTIDATQEKLNDHRLLIVSIWQTRDLFQHHSCLNGRPSVPDGCWWVFRVAEEVFVALLCVVGGSSTGLKDEEVPVELFLFFAYTNFRNKHNGGIVSWMRFRKARRSPYCPCRWLTSSTFRWTYQSLRSYSSPAWKTPCSRDSRTAESTFWPFHCDSCPVDGLQNEVCLAFSSRRCRCKFRRNFPIRFGGLRIFLLLDQVDPDVHLANSATVKHEATSEIDFLCGLTPF